MNIPSKPSCSHLASIHVVALLLMEASSSASKQPLEASSSASKQPSKGSFPGDRKDRNAAHSRVYRLLKKNRTHALAGELKNDLHTLVNTDCG